ncbi:hypothetical protein Tco_0033132 [Tanacetum coccineum]
MVLCRKQFRSPVWSSTDKISPKLSLSLIFSLSCQWDHGSRVCLVMLAQKGLWQVLHSLFLEGSLEQSERHLVEVPSTRRWMTTLRVNIRKETLKAIRSSTLRLVTFPSHMKKQISSNVLDLSMTEYSMHDQEKVFQRLQYWVVCPLSGCRFTVRAW